MLTNMAFALDAISFFDPTMYAFYIPSLNGCIGGICADMLYLEMNLSDKNFDFYASGGFVLYPNKSNTNMMLGGYKK